MKLSYLKLLLFLMILINYLVALPEILIFLRGAGSMAPGMGSSFGYHTFQPYIGNYTNLISLLLVFIYCILMIIKEKKLTWIFLAPLGSTLLIIFFSTPSPLILIQRLLLLSDLTYKIPISDIP